MGKTKIKTIDDSAQEQVKEKPSRRKSEKVAKSSESEATGEVESAPDIGTYEVSGSQQTRSERSGRVSGASTTDEPPSPRKPQKPGKAKPRSKKYQEVAKDLDRTKSYPIDQAVDMVKKLSYAKFNATIEAHINTTAQGLRGFVSLPFASGHKLRILAFGKGADQSGADFVGTDSTVEEIEKGKVDFDLLITTPEWMPKLAKVAKVLGPKGLMPNPKNGTITDDLKKAVDQFQAGKTEYKTEAKAPVIHMALGKLNQPNEELAQNIRTLLSTLGKTKIKKVRLSPTMGPSVKLDLSSI